MKTLLINNYHYARGGADTVYLNTGKLLQKKGIEVKYFSTKNEKNLKEGQNDFFIEPFEPNLSNITRFFYSQKVYKNLKRLISIEKPDIAHLHVFYGQLTSSVIKALKDCNIPMVMTMHDYRLLCPTSAMLNPKKQICEKCAGGKYQNAIIHKCNKNNYLFSSVSALESKYRDRFYDYKDNIDHFIMVSQFIKEKHLEFYPDMAKKTSILYNFKDFNSRKSNSFKEESLVFFGRLSKEKGIMTLIKALESLPKISLKILGTGPLQEHINNYLTKKGITNIKMLGFCSGELLWKHIESSKFSIIPSEWYENNPMTVIESLQLGTPVIGAKIGGIPEIVHAEHGYIFDSGSVEDLKKTIERAFALNTEDYTQMQLNGINFAQTKFSGNDHFNSLMEIYNSVMGKRNIQ